MKAKAILAILITIFVADRLGALKLIKSGFAQLTGGFRVKIYRLKVTSPGKDEELKEKLASCQIRVSELEEENFQARRLLGAGIKPQTQLVLGRVVGSTGAQTLIFISSKDQIKAGASVVSGRILLGKVRTVTGQMARADFLNAVGFKIPVKIWFGDQSAQDNRPSLAEGILIGDGKSLKIQEILATQKVAVGNWVGAVAESGDVFLIGQIEKVFPSKDKVFQGAAVKWAAKPRELLTVGIVK